MINDEYSETYRGWLAPHIAEFIQFCHAQGKAYVSYPYTLASFAKYVDEHNAGEDGITRDLVWNWREAKPWLKQCTKNKLFYMLKPFLAFLQNKGFTIYIPPKMRFIDGGFRPHIFTHGEMDAFFKACDKLAGNGDEFTLRKQLSLLFRILYCSGLRISEVLRLELADLDAAGRTLKIRKSKNGRDRLVPLSDHLCNLCMLQAQSMRRGFEGKCYLFCKKDGSPFSHDTAHDYFCKILWSAGISRGGRGIGPRVHDFRHTFAVHSLKKMHDERMDFMHALPLLSSYLGHSSVGATGHYVRLTREMFPEIVDVMSSFCNNVIPEVK
jgi:integrase